jgi:hypothetical protein
VRERLNVSMNDELRRVDKGFFVLVFKDPWNYSIIMKCKSETACDVLESREFPS